MTQQPTLKMVALSQITIGKSNPRKLFDEDAINELAASVKAKGVIQPVLLRPTEKEGIYELVCGERRYRASTIADLTEIPAYIRALTDDEALELQITENLQRKDVHPMEEAYAFKQLLERHTPGEVAARVGKKDYFINQRMKLNDLLSEWQKLFYNNFFNLSIALKIAVLPPSTQKEMLKDSDVNMKNIDKTQSISINNYKLQQYSGALNKASFDLTDITIDKKAGACNTCQFNSAVANLFPDAVKLPICSNISCFKHKVDVSFDRELKKALEDPTVIFISTNYGINDNNIVELLKKDDRNIVTRQNYCDAGFQGADIESFTEWKENKDDDAGDDELKKEYELYMLEQNKKKEQTEKKIASGKFLKAFIVDGTGKGQYKYVELQKKSVTKDSKKSAREAVDSGKATSVHIDTELDRLRDNEKRAKELDAEKVHKQIVEAIKQDKSLKTVPAAFTPVDRALMCFLILENTDFNTRDLIKKAIGFNGGTWSECKADKLFIQLQSITEEQLAFLVRTFIYQKYQNNLPHGNGGYMVRKLAELLGTIPITDLEAYQKEQADKRQKKVDSRISQLLEMKKTLKPKADANAKSKKKNATKKATKK